jgi:hypothetical protein
VIAAGRSRPGVAIVLVIVGRAGVFFAGPAHESGYGQAKPDGETRRALYLTLAPTWLDPAEMQGTITHSGSCMPGTMPSSSRCPGTS